MFNIQKKTCLNKEQAEFLENLAKKLGLTESSTLRLIIEIYRRQGEQYTLETISKFISQKKQ